MKLSGRIVFFANLLIFVSSVFFPYRTGQRLGDGESRQRGSRASTASNPSFESLLNSRHGTLLGPEALYASARKGNTGSPETRMTYSM